MRKPTHQALLGDHADVCAWQFSHTTPTPDWVKPLFQHSYRGECWRGWDAQGKYFIAQEGDWIVAIGDRALVLTNEEFTNNFRPLRGSVL